VELVVAAALSYRRWPSTDGGVFLGDVYDGDARLDFGVKLVGSGTGRRTIEADILISHPNGGARQGIDVKHSIHDVYRGRLIEAG